jgi:hypothetical protein
MSPPLFLLDITNCSEGVVCYMVIQKYPKIYFGLQIKG